MNDLIPLVWQSTLETLVMVGIAAPICGLAGLACGLLLAVTAPQGIYPLPGIHRLLSTLTNVARSAPFLILMVILIPVTRFIVGTSIGTAAAIVPLVLGGTPYAARLAEAALLEVDNGLVQAATVMGATPWQIMRRVYISESMPGLIRAFTVLGITMINFSAMAGAVGGGGLGDLAIRYGYQRFRMDILFATVVVLIVLVQLLQAIGNWLAQRFDHRATV